MVCAQCHPDRRHYARGKCRICYSRLYRVRTPEQQFIWGLWKKYRIRPEEYNALMLKQNGVCAICKKTCADFPRLSVDHCHATGLIRGLLCNACNVMISRAKENIEVLHNAVTYLTYGPVAQGEAPRYKGD